VVLASQASSLGFGSQADDNDGGANSAKTMVLLGCGNPWAADGVDVKIVHYSEGEELGGKQYSMRVLQPGEVGEVWVTSPSKAYGYWAGSDTSTANRECFLAALPDVANPSSSAKYLLTGDLGFLYGSELFICGRSKDLLIIRGY